MELLDQKRKELELQLQRKKIAKTQHVPKESSTATTFFKNLPPLQQSGNSVIDKLNVSKRQQLLKQQQSIQLKKTRVYTFNDDELDYNIIQCNEIEKYSGKRLVQRYISAISLDEFFKDKKVLRLDKLFAKVAPPNFKEPEYFNWCVIGVITKKSEPMFTTANKSSKFMKLTISDFKLNVDLTLFDQLFQKYWKLKIGDLVAILNPHIWVNRNKRLSTNINAFNITLKHDYNAVLEIGKLDIKYCKSIKKNGVNCENVVSGNETYCYYHQELLFKKTTAKRMELNGSFKMYDPINNGVKQQVLYSNTDNKIKGEIFNDPTLEKTDRFSQLSKKFSNTKLAKLFFNDDLMNIKQNYKESQNQGKIATKKRKYNEEKEPELTSHDKQKLLRQKLKASIIRDEFNKQQVSINDDDDELEIIF